MCPFPWTTLSDQRRSLRSRRRLLLSLTPQPRRYPQLYSRPLDPQWLPMQRRSWRRRTAMAQQGRGGEARLCSMGCHRRGWRRCQSRRRAPLSGGRLSSSCCGMRGCVPCLPARQVRSTPCVCRARSGVCHFGKARLVNTMHVCLPAWTSSHSGRSCDYSLYLAYTLSAGACIAFTEIFSCNDTSDCNPIIHDQS